MENQQPNHGVRAAVYGALTATVIFNGQQVPVERLEQAPEDTEIKGSLVPVDEPMEIEL